MDCTLWKAPFAAPALPASPTGQACRASGVLIGGERSTFWKFKRSQAAVGRQMVRQSAAAISILKTQESLPFNIAKSSFPSHSLLCIAAYRACVYRAFTCILHSLLWSIFSWPSWFRTDFNLISILFLCSSHIFELVSSLSTLFASLRCLSSSPGASQSLFSHFPAICPLEFALQFALRPQSVLLFFVNCQPMIDRCNWPVHLLNPIRPPRTD